MNKICQCYFEDVAGELQFSVSVFYPPGGVNGGLTGFSTGEAKRPESQQEGERKKKRVK